MPPSNASIVYSSFRPSARFCAKEILEDLANGKQESYAGLSRVEICDVLGFKDVVETAYKNGGLGLVVLDYGSDRSATRAAMKMLVDLSIACKQFSKPLPPIAIYSAEGKEKVSAFIGQVKQEKNISSIENWSPLARSGSYVLGLANRIIQFQKTNGVHQP